MERHSEFPIFVQSAVAIVGFLLIFSLVGWMFESQEQIHRASVSSGEITAVQ